MPLCSINVPLSRQNSHNFGDNNKKRLKLLITNVLAKIIPKFCAKVYSKKKLFC